MQQILPKDVSCAYIRQRDTLGLGHAVLCAKQLINNEPFAVLLADDLIDGHQNACLKQMVDVYHQVTKSIVAVQEIPLTETHKYGVVGLANQQNLLGQISQIVEKPSPEQAPSNLAVVGRYILTPAIFNYLDTLSAGAGGEIQLTDAIAQLLTHESVYAWQFAGTRYDCGSKLGYLQATFAYALKHPEVGEDFKAYLKQFL